MTLDEWLQTAVKQLEAADIGTARLDALVLLEDTLNKDRAQLLAHPETELTNEQQKLLNGFVARRVTHEPLAYIRGKTEFYGREFIINHDVLEPRPESETMIELLKKYAATEVILDIGTGSGALAITAKLELPASKVIAVDIDEKCLDVARLNSKKLDVDITLLQGDLLSPLTSDIKADIILANLPYVPDSYQINQAALQEPRIAIYGGLDGLDLYRKLFEQLASKKYGSPAVLTESLPFQHEELTKIAKQHGYQLLKEDDFIQLFTE